MMPQEGETDASHGVRVWRAGGKRGGLREDWDAIKIELMLRMARAKLAAHPELREQLLSTGDAPIVGAASTDWRSCTGHHSWSSWNGRIQEILRDELRVGDAAPSASRQQLTAMIAAYMEAEGGCTAAPLPGEPGG